MFRAVSNRSWICLVSGVVATAAVLGSVGYRKFGRWKRFEVVEPGVLLRSGSLRDWQLRGAIRQYGIRTVVSFTHTNNDSEARVCQEAGVRRHLLYLHGNGQGPPDPYLRFLQLVSDPRNRPILVHCSAGVQRTGGAVALYRVLVAGWPFDRAIDEMIAKGNEGETAQIEQLRQIVALYRPSETVRQTADRPPQSTTGRR